MKAWSRLLTMLLSAALAFVFAVQNGRQLVNIRLGNITLRAVSLPTVVFAAILLGMIVVFLVGLRADLHTRALLRRYRESLDRRE
jgi:uncharacterized integral membrane protein